MLYSGYILENGLDALLAEDQVTDVGRLYGLCTRVGALGALCAAFKDHVRRVGSSVVLDEEKESEMVPSLLHLKSRMDRIVTDGFASNTLFSCALREGNPISEKIHFQTLLFLIPKAQCSVSFSRI